MRPITRQLSVSGAWPGVTQHSALLGNYYASPRHPELRASISPSHLYGYAKNQNGKFGNKTIFPCKISCRWSFFIHFSMIFSWPLTLKASSHHAQFTARLSRALFTLLLRRGEARRTCLGCPGSELVKPVTELGSSLSGSLYRSSSSHKSHDDIIMTRVYSLN